MFGLCQIHTFVDYVRSKLTGEQFNLLFKSIILLVGVVGTIAVAIATFLGSILCEAIVLPSKTETQKSAVPVITYMLLEL